MREHAPHDAVRPQAVLDDLAEARVELPGDVVQLLAGLLVELLPGVVEDLLHLLGELARDLREVLDEVERVLDLVGDPGRQLAEGGQLLLEDHLVLGAPKVGQHSLELDVLGPHLLGQHLDEVEPLDLEGVLAEDLESVRHVGHLVVPPDIHRGLEVAPRHPPHRCGEARDPADQHPADEEPADEHQGHDADHVEGQEEDEAELDRRLRIRRRRRRPLAGGRDDALRRGDKLGFQAAIAREVLLLEPDEPKLVLAETEGAGAPRAESDQVLEVRLQIRVIDSRPGALEVPRHRVELLAKGADEVRVGDLQRLPEQALREARLGAQGKQAAVPRQLPVGSALVGRGGRVVEGPIAGRQKQDLVVDHREEDVADRAALALNIGGHGLLGLDELDPALHRAVDPVDVLDEARRDPVHLLEQVLPNLYPPHRVHDLPEAGAMGRKFGACGGKLLAGVRRDEAGRGRDEKGAPLRQEEGGVEVGNAPLGDSALGIAHVEEGVASDEARGEREREGPAETEVELPGDAEAAAPGGRSGAAPLDLGRALRFGFGHGSGTLGLDGGRERVGPGRGRIGPGGVAAHHCVRAASRSIGR